MEGETIKLRPTLEGEDAIGKVGTITCLGPRETMLLDVLRSLDLDDLKILRKLLLIQVETPGHPGWTMAPAQASEALGSLWGWVDSEILRRES